MYLARLGCSKRCLCAPFHPQLPLGPRTGFWQWGPVSREAMAQAVAHNPLSQGSPSGAARCPPHAERVLSAAASHRGTKGSS